jgi:hypothetical protein
MARGWSRHALPTLLVLSGNDLTADEFIARRRGDAALAAACDQAGVDTVLLTDADHTLSAAASREAHNLAVKRWLLKLEQQ